jgi:hypothetical protein
MGTIPEDGLPVWISSSNRWMKWLSRWLSKSSPVGITDGDLKGALVRRETIKICPSGSKMREGIAFALGIDVEVVGDTENVHAGERAI